MGARKRKRAEELKQQRQNTYFATLKNCPVSPRKMRLVTQMVKGEYVNKALDLLRFSPKKASGYAEKTLLSAIANWQQKNEDQRLEESDLFVKEIKVDEGRMLKRLQPAAMGRANIIRRRASHLTMIVDTMESSTTEEEPIESTTSEETDNTNTE